MTQPPALNGLRVLPLGGLGEIGMNCMVLEFEDEILVVDCGILFSDLDHFGVEFVIPDFTYLKDRKDKIKAFIATHGHEDHVGALPFALKAGLRAPIYVSPFTGLLVRERLKEYGLDSTTDLRVFSPGETIAFKHFKVTTASVNHSIVDAAALIIDTPVGRVVHTGDFKIDPTPFYGSKLDDRVFKKAGEDKGGTLLLLSDSTNVERHSHNPSENVIYHKFEQLFAAAEGLTIIAMFASNVGRMGQIFELARKLGKKVAVSGRSMEQNVRLAQELGYLKDVPGQLIALDDIASYDRRSVVVMTSGSQAELGSALTRVAAGEHKQIQIGPGDLVLMSSRAIPGNEKGIGRMINQLFKTGAEVLYEAVHDIHVSGHATRPELKQMLEWVKPKFFIPIHGEYRHLAHHAELAVEAGVKAENVRVVTNGEMVEFTDDSFEVVGKLEEPRVLIENREGAEISKLVLKERRQLGEKGVVFALLVRSPDDQSILAGPEIIAKGVAHESLEGFLIEEAQKVARKVVKAYSKSLDEISGPPFDLAENLRVELRRFYNHNVGKKPTVVPMILDL